MVSSGNPEVFSDNYNMVPKVKQSVIMKCHYTNAFRHKCLFIAKSKGLGSPVAFGAVSPLTVWTHLLWIGLYSFGYSSLLSSLLMCQVFRQYYSFESGLNPASGLAKCQEAMCQSQQRILAIMKASSYKKQFYCQEQSF